VVEVDSLGNLLAVSCGKATVTAKDSRTGLSAACAVTVVPERPQRRHQLSDKVDDQSVTLVWGKVAQATGYYVYRRKADGHFQYLAGTTGNSYCDKSVSDCREYVYLVKAYCSAKDGILTGEGSAAATAVTRPAAVKKLTVTPDKGKLTLKWQSNSRADSYLIYRAAAKDGKYERIAETADNRLTLFVKAGKAYAFKVRAVKDFGGKRVTSALSDAAVGKAV
jgi:fibronectin type 3 domain-containing protein